MKNTRAAQPTREEFLAAIKEQACVHPRLTWKIFHRATGYHVRLLAELGLGKWNQAKSAAGVARTPKGKPQKWSRDEVIQRVQKMYARAKRPIVEDDFEKTSDVYPVLDPQGRRGGGWTAAEPSIRATHRR